MCLVTFIRCFFCLWLLPFTISTASLVFCFLFFSANSFAILSFQTLNLSRMEMCQPDPHMWFNYHGQVQVHGQQFPWLRMSPTWKKNVFNLISIALNQYPCKWLWHLTSGLSFNSFLNWGSEKSDNELVYSAHVCTIFKYENCSCTRSLKMLRTASWSNQEHVDHSVHVCHFQ